MGLLLILGRGSAIALALLTFITALRAGGGWGLLRLALGIGILTVVLGVLTEPGAALLRIGPITLTSAGLASGSERAARLIGLASVGWWMAHALGVERLADLAVRMTWPLERRWSRFAGLGFAVGLALRFLPEIGNEVGRIRLALAARPPRTTIDRRAGGALSSIIGKWRERIDALAQLFLPLLAGTVRRAGEVARTLEARGYGSGSRTPLLVARLTRREQWLSAGMIGAALIAIAADRIASRG